MNLIQTEAPYQNQKEGFYFLHQWRNIDHSKIEKFVREMFGKIEKLDPEFHAEIEKKSNISTYLGDFITYMDDYIIVQKYKENEKKFNFFVPKIVYNNFYLLNNALYVPISMLEKSPIDRVTDEEGKKNKIYANLNPIYNFTFDFISGFVFFKNKKIEIDIFLRILYKDNEKILEDLQQNGLINIKDEIYSKDELKKFSKFLGFHKETIFEEMSPKDFIDNFLILDYYHELFEDFYGLKGIEEVVWKIVELFLTGKNIDMANIKNRRIVHVEYLLKPLFESYLRLLYGIIDRKSQNFLISMNPKVILTTGFTQLLHGGNLYDISLPYPSPLINKVSQDISIIKEGRLPKSWQRNDKSAFGVLCPITISASKPAANVVFTTDTQVNKFGRILLNNFEEDFETESGE